MASRVGDSVCRRGAAEARLGEMARPRRNPEGGGVKGGGPEEMAGAGGKRDAAVAPPGQTTGAAARCGTVVTCDSVRVAVRRVVGFGVE
jgi:hypothetical protein